ncbi:hypothetical protein DFP72DRAFT_874580 [Ephemerocybe angulata]|uniref:BAG domain-containing protein n=1 Tax=Ephemerocybe angulata TaxID=980116 RepID=A0A8H6IFV0_9AGAR|nr:hypothetical protein DFP72DRAFT_874580 [Tulosesus angulatus]
MSVTVKWGRERLSFALPARDTPLKALRQSLQEYTQIQDFKLIHKGAVLNDNNATLAQYHIVPGSVIVLLPTARAADAPIVSDREPEPAPAVGLTTEESALLTTIHTELATVRSSLTPELNDLLASPEPHDKKQYLRLGELLLQSLLRLDALAPQREWEHARTARKEAVREVQALLDTLDDTIAARKAAGVH